MFPICLVDDSRDDLMLEERALRQCRIVNPIKSLLGGEACVDFLTKHYGLNAPRTPAPLLFIDLTMPGMDGVQTIAKINQAPVNASPWIVMVSGMEDLKKVSEGYQLGAKTFLAKPFQSSEIESFLKSYESSILTRLTAQGFELHWG